MKSHEVSVVIATYKGAETLRYVLEGSKRQTFEDFEVVAVVKPSADEVRRLCGGHTTSNKNGGFTSR